MPHRQPVTGAPAGRAATAADRAPHSVARAVGAAAAQLDGLPAMSRGARVAEEAQPPPILVRGTARRIVRPAFGAYPRRLRSPREKRKNEGRWTGRNSRNNAGCKLR